MKILYNFSIWLYNLAALVLSLFNEKAKKWVNGQKEVFKYLESLNTDNVKIAWFHSASLGEFEQGRPVIEAFKEKYPEFKILITFFSPSGYEIRKNYEKADYICYLPLDKKSNVKKFISIINPKIAFFIKYEFWFNYLKILHERRIPTYLISGIFRENQHFFKVYGFWFRKQLKHFTYFFLQNPESEKLLKSINIHNVMISGDTRFDRVTQIAQNPKSFPLIEKFKSNNSLILLGSSWQNDEQIVIDFLQKNKNHSLKFIFAPHEVQPERIKKLQALIPDHSILFSDLNETNCLNHNILIINNIGMLSHLYQYANLAFIGGGFGKGIHNILEATTFGIPTIFGPNYQKFTEAKELIKLNGAFTIHDMQDFESIILNLLFNENEYIKSKNICLNYIKTRSGATNIILNNIDI